MFYSLYRKFLNYIKREEENYSLLPNWKFREENLEEFNERYSGFGREFYKTLDNSPPNALVKIKLYQSLEYQTEDSIAIYSDNTTSFGIQLDPFIEVIVLWNKENHIEISSHTVDAYQVAIDQIRTKFLKP